MCNVLKNCDKSKSSEKVKKVKYEAAKKWWKTLKYGEKCEKNFKIW